MSEQFWFDYANKRFCGTGPDQCPLCHHKISTGQPHCHSVMNSMAQCVFSCPGCNNFFIAYYEMSEIPISMSGTLLGMTIKELKPYNHIPVTLSEIIQNISPLFSEIYNEALVAQESGLKQICGPGYRKAFEFLVKDYAKSRTKIDSEKKNIEACFSGDVVKKYIEDKRIQSVAKRALWLGNDETHYLRKWTDHDVEDLITLIKLTIYWIEISELSEKYVDEMP